MKGIFKFCLLSTVVIAGGSLWSQNETNKWYFGANAGLDFMNSPPTILTNGAMNTSEGCASIADGAGNLLFYTDGMTIWDQTHAIMANGTGLFGTLTPCQSSLILKKPGSTTLFYVFTLAGISNTLGLNYSIVDMSLAAGMGSVTIKNAPIFNGPCAEKITGTKHCNGTDFWVVIHQHNSSNFLAYQLSSAGVNTTAITSSIGIAVGPPYSLGCMKISVNGKKLGMSDYAGYVDLFDFDSSTGIVSNWTPLLSGYSSYGCEFSPDGTKFYVGGFGSNGIKQWDLCAGSGTAIAASIYSIPATSLWTMQLASNGKIYVARSSSTLGVISNPNLAGAACNYTDNGQSIGPNNTYRSLPNFIGSLFAAPKTPAPPFTFTASPTICRTVFFNAPAVNGQTVINCAVNGYSLNSLSWNFGDPLSGASNTSTLSNPTHTYSAAGNFTTTLILYYSCTGGTDTLRQMVTVSAGGPTIAVSGKTTVCAGEKTNLNASGAASYSWSTGASGSSLSITPTITAGYTVTGTTNSCSSTKTIQLSVNKCTGFSSSTPHISINIFPNPARDLLHVEADGEYSFELLDAAGRTLITSNVYKGLNSVSLGQISEGLYYVKMAKPGRNDFYRLLRIE